MHELSIAMSIVDGVLEEAKHHGGERVEAVHMRLGRLSGVDKDALLFSYTIACQETPLAQSRLVIEDVDVTIFCPSCADERPTRSFPVMVCAECGAVAERIVRGEEMEIKAMELAA